MSDSEEHEEGAKEVDDPEEDEDYESQMYAKLAAAKETPLETSPDSGLAKRKRDSRESRGHEVAKLRTRRRATRTSNPWASVTTKGRTHLQRTTELVLGFDADAK